MSTDGLPAAVPGRAMRRNFLQLLAAAPLLGATASYAAGAVAGPAGQEQPARIAVVGDSQAQGLAIGLQRIYRQDPRVRILDHARISTGLIRLNFFDWPSYSQQIAPSLHAAAAVVMFGANDRPAVRIGGFVDDRLLQDFTALYGGRARTVIHSFRAAGSGVIWVGHPVVRGEVYAEDMAIINRICQQACVAEGAVFVPLWDLFTDAAGHYTAYGPGPDGQTTRLRNDDGVHLSPAGYVLAAQRIQRYVDAMGPRSDSAKFATR